jgi:hypothetical protein
MASEDRTHAVFERRPLEHLETAMDMGFPRQENFLPHPEPLEPRPMQKPVDDPPRHVFRPPDQQRSWNRAATAVTAVTAVIAVIAGGVGGGVVYQLDPV